MARAMIAAWHAAGVEGVAEVLAKAERAADDEQVWAVLHELARNLPASDRAALAIAGIQRTVSAIQQQARRLGTAVRERGEQIRMEFT